MKHLVVYTKTFLFDLLKRRDGETKLGERLADDWQTPSVKFVLLGVEEDIGVRVNNGIGGTHTAWRSFMSAFVNIQNTPLLDGSVIGVYGHFNFDDLKDNVLPETVEIIDTEVFAAVQDIVSHGKIPIVIGGGHNNAYPIIKGVSSVLNKKINTINLDAHSDFRRLEGRHSGNGFRYAFTEGVLDKYAVIGLHQNYNSAEVIKELSQNSAIWFCYWEDIFLYEKLSFKNALDYAVDFTKNAPTGIELDLDCIENTLSSAMTPCGISTTQARQYVHHLAQRTHTAYLHICEGATQLTTGAQSPLIGKLISYLVSDFMKSFIQK